MKPWTNTHTIAMLWLIVACMFLGWIVGLVQIREQELQWGSVTPAPKHVPASACMSPALRGAFCP